MGGYIVIAMFLLAAIVFPAVTLLVSYLVAPKKPGWEKQTTYECGLDTDGTSQIQYRSSYFLYTLAYLLFGVEVIFLYPWAIQFKELSLLAHGMMFIFIIVLVIGLAYDWKEGALEWDK